MNIFVAASKKEIGKVQRWLIPSLYKQNDIQRINLTIIDYLVDSITTHEIKKFSTDKLAINVISPPKQTGFGESHNFAFTSISPDNFFLIINPDIYLNESCLAMLKAASDNRPHAGIIEAKQLPFEHPKEFDNITKETPWASGAAMLVNPEMFDKVNGFDPNYWMYVEDVDLSWRCRIAGYNVVYSQEAAAYHFTGAHFEYNDSRFYLEHFWSARNYIYICYKFFGNQAEKMAIQQLYKTTYPDLMKEEILKNYAELKTRLVINNFQELRSQAAKYQQIKVAGFNLYHNTRK